MENQNLFNILFSLMMGVAGWLFRELWSAVKELKSDLSTLRESLPKDYVMREDYRQDMREVKELLNKIFDKLESKVDK